MRLVMFTKMLQEFPVAEAARRIKQLGFDGVDLTVRPGGHIDPKSVGTALPEAAKAVKEQGLEIAMLTTAITTAADPAAEATAAAAAHEGVRLLKLGYWMAEAGKLAAGIDRARRELDGLERLAETYRVTFGIHNHSGPGYVNCQPAVIWALLRDRDPARIAAYFDPGHAAVEGGSGGWSQALELLTPHLRMVAVKDFGWQTRPGRPKVRWRPIQVPLEEGLVPWQEVFEHLTRSGFDGPVSFHSEYKGGGSWRDLSTPELIEQTAADLRFIRGLMGA